jgi:ATP synthase protein I
VRTFRRSAGDLKITKHFQYLKPVFSTLTVKRRETMVRAISRGSFDGFLLVFDLETIMSKSGDKPAKDRLQDFEKRLDKTLSAREAKNGPDTTEGSAAGLAMRAVSELLVGLVVCMVGGYYLDRYLGTAPWIMIGLMPLGLAAGVMNVMRLSNSKQANEIMGGSGPMPPSVKDDDED